MRSTVAHGLAGVLSLAGFAFTPTLASLNRQPSILVVTVVDSVAGYPLVNADVIESRGV